LSEPIGSSIVLLASKVPVHEVFAMAADSHRSSRAVEADIIAEDRDGRAILIVELKAMNGSGRLGIEQTLKCLKASGASFGMFADFDRILVFGKGRKSSDDPILYLNTSDVLSFYEPRFAEKTISEEYFATLIEAWLRDMAFHWKSAQPPALEEMRAIGLAGRLEGGMARREVIYASRPIH
jgi:hypothetical protein